MKADHRVTSYRRHASSVTDAPVDPPLADAGRRRRLGRARSGGDARWSEQAGAEANEVLAAYDHCVESLDEALERLSALRRPALIGKVEDEQRRVEQARVLLGNARDALHAWDLGGCGRAVAEARHALSAVGGPLALALGGELRAAAVSRERQAALHDNLERRRGAQRAVEEAQGRSPRAGALAAAQLSELMAEGFALLAEVLGQQAAPPRRRPRAAGGDEQLRILAPQELETFVDVGGLDAAKDKLRRVLNVLLQQGAGGRAGVVQNGVLLHGPPGTGKSLLARACAGEYGLRFIRFSPAAIASAYQHEPAKKLRQVFAAAADVVPCLLFLDELDAIAARRDGVTSADQREVVVELMTCLEEYREVPGLLIMAATNALDHLDPALREGRFDSRIAVPLPDAEARRAILEVQLDRVGPEVAPDTLDLDQLAELTAGRSGAALASMVAGAADRALEGGHRLGQDDLLAEIVARSGQDRAVTVEEQLSWDDVVLPPVVREQLREMLLAFERPELGRALGVRPPAGILLHGPPGTGKTTIAKALAAEVRASFYEQSAADLMSKWLGESEQKVAQLFARARSNRPSIIFLDEIDALVPRRSSGTATPSEERVVSQFLQELDGLQSGEGVLLVGATNRPDMIDEAVRERRLVPVELPLPDEAGRAQLIEVLCRDVRLAPDVDVGEVVAATEGLSGADLKRIRNAAGMKALARVAREASPEEPAVTRDDFARALAELGRPLAERRPAARKVAGATKGAKRPSTAAKKPRAR